MLNAKRVLATLPVRDVERSRRFYRKILGLREIDLGIPEAAVLAIGDGGGAIQLEPHPDATPSRHTVATFEVGRLEDTIADLEREGVKFEEYDEPEYKTVDKIASMGPLRVAWFKDPDGNILCLHELSPKARRSAPSEPRADA